MFIYVTLMTFDSQGAHVSSSVTLWKFHWPCLIFKGHFT